MRHGRPGPARLGPARAPAWRRACGSTRTPRIDRITTTRGRPAAAHLARSGHRRPGRPGHRCARPAAAAAAAVRRAGLRLRADDRAAHRGAARRRSAGATGRASATAATSSTTTGSPPTTGSSGAVTTRSTTTAAGSPRSTCCARPPSRVLADHFAATFPQLEGVRFTHKWGGVIDCCSRFSAFFGTAYGGRLAYAVGYTGLGVGATRFGAKVMLDLLGPKPTELTRLKMVRGKPLPFPPEPARSARDPADPMVDRAGGPPRRPPQPVAARPRPPRPRLRLLSTRTGTEIVVEPLARYGISGNDRAGGWEGVGDAHIGRAARASWRGGGARRQQHDRVVRRAARAAATMTDVDGRRVDRLRGRHRGDQRRQRRSQGRRGGPGAGRAVHPHLLHDRAVRGVRGGV